MAHLAPDGTPEELTEESIARRLAKRRKLAGEFVRGPLPLSWFARVGMLPGKAVVLGLAIWFRKGLGDREPIRISPALLKRFRISRFAAYRALTAMEAAGLLHVERHRGRCAEATVLNPKNAALDEYLDELLGDGSMRSEPGADSPSTGVWSSRRRSKA